MPIHPSEPSCQASSIQVSIISAKVGSHPPASTGLNHCMRPLAHRASTVRSVEGALALGVGGLLGHQLAQGAGRLGAVDGHWRSWVGSWSVVGRSAGSRSHAHLLEQADPEAGGEPAVDHQGVAGDERGVVGRQEGGGGGDLRRVGRTGRAGARSRMVSR